jgi:hypothetical protein
MRLAALISYVDIVVNGHRFTTKSIELAPSLRLQINLQIADPQKMHHGHKHALQNIGNASTTPFQRRMRGFLDETGPVVSL